MKKDKVITGQNKKALTVWRVILTAISAAVTCWIFWNSSLSADDSTEQSSPLTDSINDFLRSLNIPLVLDENAVRKAAHFTEYAVLGALLAVTVYMYVRQKPRKRIMTAAIALPIGAVVAVCDELIQTTSAGRSCEVRDMFIDFSGVLFSTLIVIGIISLREKENAKNKGRVPVSEIKENKMGVKPVLPLLIGMSLPAMFSMMIQALYNVVDSIFVAQYNPDALQAVSLAYPLQMILISVAVGTALGVNSLIARRLGAKNFKEADTAATTGLVLAVIDWAVFLVIGLVFARPFISLFTGDQTVIGYGTQYLTVVLCVSMGMMVATMGEKILQATGNMIFPMLTQLMGAVINIILDPLLIYGVGFFPELGVLGAAIATVFAQFCSMTFILLVLFLKKHEVKIRFKGFRMSKMMLKNIYSVGFPAIIMQSIGSVMVSGINLIISWAGLASEYAAAYINAFGIYFKLQSFVFMPVFGLNQGVSPIIGYNYGARNRKRMYTAFNLGLVIAAGIMGLGTLLFSLAPEWLLSLFESSAAADAAANARLAEVGVPMLRIVCLSFMLAACGIMFSTLFQAVGKGFYSMVMSICRQLVILLPVAFVLSKINMTVVWFAFPIAEIICLFVAIGFFIRLKRKELNFMEPSPA